MSSFAFNQVIILDLYNRLKPVQQTMMKIYLGLKHSRKYILHCSRRLGKTFLLCVLASVVCLSKSNAQVRYASVTQKSVRNMIKPIFKKIFSAYKPKFRPKWNSVEGAYIFPNGSMIHVAGVNNGHEDDLRGTDADLAIVDEGGFVDNLEYLVESVLVPQLINTGGKLLIASSSPLSPAHEFAEYIHAAKAGDYYSSFDIFSSGYSQELVAEFMKEAGGSETTTWRREYLNELIVDSEFAIVPEVNGYDFTVKKPPEHYSVYHKYVSMDLGVLNDLNFSVFGYYDFLRGKLVIEDEHFIKGPEMTTPLLHREIAAIEKRLWNAQTPYKRVADNNNPLLLLDLGSIHNMYFNSTDKDNLHAMVNELRVWFKNGRIEISEKCKMLINTMKYAVWDTNRQKFGRSKVYGHYDGLAALMYMVRNIDQTTNPIPVKVDFNQHYTPQAGATDVFKAIIGKS